MKQVFRKMSLDRLASPERLDHLVTVTSPAGWASLLAIGLVIATALLWSFLGTLPTTVMGGGILLKKGGMASVAAPVSGQLEAIYVHEGDQVDEGQLVARAAQPGLLEKVEEARRNLEGLEQRQAQGGQIEAESLDAQLESFRTERGTLRSSIAVKQERLGWLHERVGSLSGLLEQGLITRQTLLDTKAEEDQTSLAIESVRDQLKGLDAKEKALLEQQTRQALSRDQQIADAESALALLEAELEYSTRIVSQFRGIVVEVRAVEGQIVHAGDPLLSLEAAGEDAQELQALIYVPSDQGKRIRPGMQIQISPQTVRREEYGYILGTVTEVAGYPSSPQGMKRYLGNETLVTQYSSAGAPIAVMAVPLSDPSTISGFRWSSSSGPPTWIQAGTPCLGFVEVQTQSPISLVFPYLKKLSGLDT